MFLATTDERPRYNPPPGHTVIRLFQANAARLWELHQQQLSELTPHNPPKPTANLEEVAVMEDRCFRMAFADKISRGVWVEMTEAEVQALRAKTPPPLWNRDIQGKNPGTGQT